MGITVNLRWLKYDSGTQSAYLDIINNGIRKKEFIDIKIKKGDTKKKEKKLKAEAIRTKRHNAIIDKKYELVSEDKLNVDFIQYYQVFLKNYKKAGIKKYRYAYEKFLLFLKEEGLIKKIIATPDNLLQPYSTVDLRLPFKELTKEVCQGYKDYLYGPKSGLTGETPYDYYKRFKALVNRAFEERFLLINVSSLVKLKKPEGNLEKQILTKNELQVLAKTPIGNEEVKRAFLFACFTGLGEKEIRLLTWKEVVDDRLNTKRAKNGIKVSFKLSKTAINLLGKYGPKDQKVFRLPSNVAIAKNLKNWMKRAKIDKHITFYCGRHSFAVMHLREGTNLKTISKLMGHKSTVPTNKYLNYLDADKDKAIENLPDLAL